MYDYKAPIMALGLINKQIQMNNVNRNVVKDCWFVGSLGSWQTHLVSMCCYGKITLDTYQEPVVPHHN